MLSPVVIKMYGNFSIGLFIVGLINNVPIVTKVVPINVC